MKANGVVFTVVICCLLSCTTRYYIVRHAEKACDDCASCGLTQAGVIRANALKDILLSKGIDSIFASQCQRTRLTARPTADAIGKQTSIYQTSQLSSFIETLKRFNDSRDILVVGHSDQIPVIIDSLTHRRVSIGANDFDNLYIITKKRCLRTTIRLTETVYGAPSP